MTATIVGPGGTVTLDTATLAALETITVANPTANPETGLAKDASLVSILANLARRFGASLTPITADVSALGETTVHTPAAGNAIRLYWFSAINSGSSESVIKIRLDRATGGARYLYNAPAGAHWEVFEGGADKPLIVALSVAGTVPFTAHLEEFTP